MTSPTSHRRPGRTHERGQMIVIFTLCLVAIIAMAGLLIDGGMAWSNRRQAQAAADTAALAAAKAVVTGGDVNAAALAVANLNGFGIDTTDCQGVTLPGNAGPGIQVNSPPLTGPHAGATDFVEVYTTRKMTTTFSGAVGVPCWMVTARAVSSIGTKSVASCSFCSLNRTSKNHTLVLKNGATLRVDGDIYVNSSNGGASGACVPDPSDKGKWLVCGDGFDIFGDGGSITARTISVTGGWETHDGNPVKADYRVKMGNGSPCPQAPDPVQQVAPWLPSNVCIHMPQIADPLNDGSVPANMIPVPPIVGKPVAGVNGCPASGVTIPSGTAGSPSILSIQGSVTTKICPGTYYGGIKISGSANVTMLPGVYYIAGGGFLVSGAGSVDGTAGVMIYNSSGTADVVDTQEGVDLVPKSTPGHINLKNAKLKATPDKNIEIDEVVTLTLDPDGGAAPAPTGLVTFFDGNDPIPGCVNLPTTPTSATKSRATCTTSWATFGTKSISGVYYGDAVYNADGDAKTLTIPPPAGATIAPVTIGGSGNVKLYGESSGVYKGLTIFQNRSSTLTITLEPGAGAPACTGSWLTADVPDVDGVDPPAACGPLGGLRGTIYAAHSDALVFITASGLSNLQVISGKIQVDSDADARFAYTPEYFANGSIRLVE